MDRVNSCHFMNMLERLDKFYCIYRLVISSLLTVPFPGTFCVVYSSCYVFVVVVVFRKGVILFLVMRMAK